MAMRQNMHLLHFVASYTKQEFRKEEIGFNDSHMEKCKENCCIHVLSVVTHCMKEIASSQGTYNIR
jgi:hypothetical protein